mmetsp:Transcript_21076/g.64200  ORF Transcript_21076/g.64200 Transcript_21076/m.64200 type:complete len:83 (-) Transcript_21076:116-364(-)
MAGPSRVPPAGEGSIARCPTGEIREADLSGEDKSCAICLEEYTVGQQYRRLPCLHKFHTDCIDPWLRTSGVCPCCKMPVQAD